MRPGLAMLQSGTRVVLNRVGLDGRVMRLLDGWRARRAAKRSTLRLGPDGLPVPPDELIEQVHGPTGASAGEFLRGGETGRRIIAETLARHGVAVEELGVLLDFGVGCGRVARYWVDLDTDVHGCDYNPGLVEWCQENLPHVTAVTNRLDPPLPYDDGRFDLVYSLSVFTHLTEALQRPWSAELRRVTRSGGHVLFTVIGPTFPHPDPGFLTPEIAERLERGELIVLTPEHAGRNCCAALHPRSWVEDNMLDGFELVEYVERGAGMSGGQDIFLVRRVD
ncbi:MAG: class I SAM-dependent methyltransferase [Solirubrobacterales bacterium]